MTQPVLASQTEHLHPPALGHRSWRVGPLARVTERWLWVDVIGPTLAIRLAVMLAAPLLALVINAGAVPRSDPILGIWNQWDAPHFVDIALHGYGPPTDPARIVLFPLLPIFLAIASNVATPLVAGMAFSLVSTLAAAAGLYQLLRVDYGRRLARNAVLAVSLFPTAFALVAPYSEAIFLALTVWCLVAVRGQRWHWAGFLGMLAAATRLQGVFLLPAVLLEYWIVRRRLTWDVLWLGLIGLGLVYYLALNLVVFGDPLAFVSVQRTVFLVSNIAPWNALGNLVSAVLTGGHDQAWVVDYVAPLAAEIGLAFATLWAARSWRRQPASATYALISLVSFSTLSWPISLPRYVLGVPAIFAALASLFRRPVIGPAVQALSVMLFTLFLGLFVTGQWAT